MKKIIITLIAVLLASPSYAKNFFKVEWSEFCPGIYSNISTTKRYFIAEKKYWSRRRKVFESRIEICNSYSGDLKDDCMEDLRKLEMQTSLYYFERLKVTVLDSVFNSRY